MGNYGSAIPPLEKALYIPNLIGKFFLMTGYARYLLLLLTVFIFDHAYLTMIVYFTSRLIANKVLLLMVSMVWWLADSIKVLLCY